MSVISATWEAIGGLWSDCPGQDCQNSTDPIWRITKKQNNKKLQPGDMASSGRAFAWQTGGSEFKLQYWGEERKGGIY
jgi:hypothetical protein